MKGRIENSINSSKNKSKNKIRPSVFEIICFKHKKNGGWSNIQLPLESPRGVAASIKIRKIFLEYKFN